MKMQEPVDVLIIGSGHSGGMAAKILTERGINCLMLNAGPLADVPKNTEKKAAADLPYRGFRPPSRLEHVFQSNEFNANVWVDEKEVPYTHDAQTPYNWVRVRLFGGRSLFWSRQSFRLSDYELKGKSYDGFGDDWPIDHAELSPYYDRVEAIFHVTGTRDGIPQMPDGNFIQDKSPWVPSMTKFRDVCDKRGIPLVKQRRSEGVDGLASSVNLLLPDAFKTGKLQAMPNVIVREITVDKNTGLANGAHFVDRVSRREMTVKARVVVLAAGTLESTRLLLNSGIANSSGVMGHYLSDQIYGVGITASDPAMRGNKSAKVTGGGAIMPRFRNIKDKAPNFLRGYAFNVFKGSGPMEARCFATYGQELEDKLDTYHGSGFTLNSMMDVLSHYENHVRINKDIVDAWGIPTLHIHQRHGDNEINMAKDAADTAEELAHEAGFEVLAKNAVPNPPGYSIHELGTCRMGDNPKTSVLNKYNQSHDIKNLFVVDASAFVCAGWQNPTMTIAALSMRSSEYLVEQMRLRNV